MANFRFRSWRYTDTVPFVDRQVDMEVWYNQETNRLSFQINSAPYPYPADSSGGGWFVLDEDETILWMNRMTKIDFTKWERNYRAENHTGWTYNICFYISDGEMVETRVAGLLPPQWEEFIRLMEILYPVHCDREFTWPAGIKYPAEEKKKQDERLKEMYEKLSHPDIEEDFCGEFEDLEVFLPDDYGL